MKDLRHKKKHTNESYVRHINSIIDENYEMFTKEHIAFVPKQIDEKETLNTIKTVPVITNYIRHKSCGHTFWIERVQLLSKIKKGLPLCPYCSVKKKK